VWLTRASDNGDARFVSDPLLSPLAKSFFNPVRVGHIIFLGLLALLLTLLFGGPDALALIDVDDGGLVALGGLHDHGNHLVGLRLASRVLA